MNLRYLILVFILIFAFFSHGFSNEPNYSDEYQSIRVEIEGKNYEIEYKISSRHNLDEGAEYNIRDNCFSRDDSEFYVSGYRNISGPRPHYWIVSVHNTPSAEEKGDGILLRIYFEKTRNEARAIYKDIFWQIYEKVGVSENNYPY